MSKFGFSVYLNAYGDSIPSNNPAQNNFKWNRDLSGLIVDNPVSVQTTLAPGETRSFFSGMRTLLQDGTTVYSLALKPLSTNTYVLSATSGTLPNFRTPRAIAVDATTQITASLNGPVMTFSAPAVVAVAASFTGQVAGMTTNVTIVADNAGVIGNSASLTGDGTSTLNQLIVAWNTANPSNTMTLQAGDDTQVPNLAAVIQLAGGVNAATALDTTAVVVGDFVQIGSNFNPLNQGNWQIISKTASSVSVVNEGGSNEGPILLGSGFATQFDIFSSDNVQIGDTLVISGGFSPVTQGAYKVTEVSANSLQFYFTAPLPQESGIQTQAIAIYSRAKSFIYLEADSACNVILNGVTVANIQPFVLPGVLGSTTQPGVFMLNSTIYSLSLQNTGVNPVNVFFASVE
jgi:hypothetical protein